MEEPPRPQYMWCPICAKEGDHYVELVPRTNKLGKNPGLVFLGCENFMKTGCRYTMPIDQCPRCNGKLREKTSKTGNTFLGCANFQSKRCRYTRSIQTQLATNNLHSSPSVPTQLATNNLDSSPSVPIESMIDLNRSDHAVIDWMIDNGDISSVRWPRGYENITNGYAREEASDLGFDDMAEYNAWLDNHE